MTNICYISLSSKLDVNEGPDRGAAEAQYTALRALGPWGCPVTHTLKQ